MNNARAARNSLTQPTLARAESGATANPSIARAADRDVRPWWSVSGIVTMGGLNERIEMANPRTVTDSNHTDGQGDGMTATRSIVLRPRPSLAVRRAGYVVAIVINI